MIGSLQRHVTLLPLGNFYHGGSRFGGLATLILLPRYLSLLSLPGRQLSSNAAGVQVSESLNGSEKSEEMTMTMIKTPSTVEPTEPGYLYILKRTLKGKRLPIYSEYKNGRTRIVTIIRRIVGDLKALENDLKAALPYNTSIHLRSDLSQIWIKGHHVKLLQKIFTEKGF